MRNRETTRNMILAALFAALTAAGAFVRIPVGPSVITLQFFVTALSGVILGGKWGALSQMIYILIGLTGIPVFAVGGGLGYFLQPSCGFVIALPIAAFVIGSVSNGGSSPLRTVIACLWGLIMLYAVGTAYMALILNVYLNEKMSFTEILSAAVLPFLIGDGIKIAAVTAAAKLLPKHLLEK